MGNMIKFVVLAFFVVTCRCKKLHDDMTDEEIQSVFHVPRNKVPDYEVVPIRSSFRNKNCGGGRITMEMSDESIDLSLDPTEDLLIGENTPIYLSKPNKKFDSGVEYIPVKNGLRNITIYQCPSNRVALVVERRRRGFSMFGVINDRLIRPIPSRLTAAPAGLLGILFGNPRNQILRFGSSYGNDSIEETHHIVMRAAPRPTKIDHVHFGHRRLRKSRGISQLSLPPVIFPEILVVMDNDLFKTQKEDVNTAILYLLSFWNAVDLRYRSMKKPEIRLKIAALVISVEEGGAPYIDNHKLKTTNEGLTQVDADKALMGMGKYFYLDENLPDYDAAIAMTRTDICNMLDSPFVKNICDGTTLGYAYVEGVCKENTADKNTEAVGVVEDNGGFSGIIPAAHELAHLLGVQHDKGECADGGYIMSTQLHHSEKSFQWSNCSKKAFRKFFSTAQASCLLNKPSAIKKNKSGRVLPGKIQSLDEQCEKVFGVGVTKACQHKNTCILLQCQVPGKPFCRGFAAPAEGSTCGPQKHCISGHCVPLQI
ncbi:A disintegrin and metalloproteinase with thrombospondin motifs 18-like [Fopius arisanus]|uniref:A disintegrin and metalloproteinase with thrombospondin motifs 18-like n=2 Tax=Fopius arisanus TaxID=64838 RepID=A0A9R1T5V9_9HYME|nr:PREDICTED: A disintegrin and metalloproteinase with thrombospondin motifs 18-like [Fopius arisanus]